MEICRMLGKLVVSVVLLPMLVHSILGCCWHHAHSESDRSCEHSTAETHTGHSHSHDQPSENHVPVVPAPYDHHESCDDVRCVYVAAEPVRNMLAVDLQSHVAVLDSCGILTLNATFTASRNWQSGHEVPASSQRRALTQIWVV